MLGSDFFEQLVKKENTDSKALVTFIIGCAVTLLIVVASFVLQAFVLLFLALITGFATWYLATNCRIEYEYVMAEEELSITKILAERKRKPMITTTLPKFTAFGKLNDAPALPDSYTLVLACAALNDDTYYAEFTHEMYGNVRLLMTPDEQFLTYFARKLPRNLHFTYTPAPKEASEQTEEAAS